MAGLMRQKAEDNGFISEDFIFSVHPPVLPAAAQAEPWEVAHPPWAVSEITT